jgi:peptidoglycan/LPS O-acetylase OafA/YrhL
VLNQFRDHPVVDLGARLGWVAKGYIGAGLYLVAGGYLMMESYEGLRAAGRFRYDRFLWRRLSTLYPLHLLVLAWFAATLPLSRLIGGPLHAASFNVADLPANLLFVQAWGFVPTDSWNFPSWLASADWFMTLAVPIVAWISLRPIPPILPALAAVGLFVAMFLFAGPGHRPFTDLTTLGALQAIPAALLGAAIWRLQKTLPPAPAAGAWMAGLAAGWIVAAAGWQVSDLVIWPAFAPLVLGVAMASRAAPRARAVADRLGRLAIAMQLVYLPVDIAYFRGVRAVLGEPHGAAAWLALLGVFPLVLAAAALAHYGVQRPLARRIGRATG